MVARIEGLGNFFRPSGAFVLRLSYIHGLRHGLLSGAASRLGWGDVPQWADMPLIAEALQAGGFADTEVEGIMGRNWVRFFGQRLAKG
jgi:hypothetical protein